MDTQKREKRNSMEFGFGFGFGWALGIIFGIHLSRVCWPDNNESVWERRRREQNMVKNAVKCAREQDSSFVPSKETDV